MRKFIKIILILLGSAAISVISASACDEGIPVLMYHHILPKDDNINFQDNAIVLDLEDFEWQMRYLHDNGFHTLTAAEVTEILYDDNNDNNGDNNNSDNKYIWLTFDDGYYSNLIYAYPILKKYNFTATIFAVTSYITDDVIPMDADKLVYLNWREMQDYYDVFEFASHSDNMHDVINVVNGTTNVTNVTKLENATKDEIADDIIKSISYNKINVKYAFSYPYGRYNDKVIDVLKNFVKIAVTVRKGYLKEYTNPYEIPRFNIYRGISMERFKLIVK